MGSTAVLEQKLVAAGCEARVVRTTAEAALVVLSERVDLILSEVRLEPVDGFIFLERLRADKRTCDLPVIFVSDRTAPEDLNRGFELGALDYIFKPYTPEVLVAKVRRVLDQRPAAGR
jgi:DNA-binding response OmpR family regulator